MKRIKRWIAVSIVFSFLLGMIGIFGTQEIVSAATLARPTIKVTTSSGNPKITIGKVAGATGYRIYRKTATDQKWVKVVTTKKTAYVDKKWKAAMGSKVRYTVKAYYKDASGKITWSKTAAVKNWTVPTKMTKVKVAIPNTARFELTCWKKMIDPLKAEGIDLEIVEVDWERGVLEEITTNNEIDLCPYGAMEFLRADAELYGKYGSKVTPVGYETSLADRIFSPKYESLKEIPDGTVVTVQYYAAKRALKTLEAAGLLKLKKELPVAQGAFGDDFQGYLDSCIDQYLKDIKIEGCYTVDAGAAADQYDVFVTDMSYSVTEKGRTLHELFTEPRTDEGYMTTILARTEDTKDPAKLDLFEKVVEAYQSEETAAFYETVQNEKPAGWDIDVISRYR